MTTQEALFILAAQASRGSDPSYGRPFLVWPEYAAVDAVCAFGAYTHGPSGAAAQNANADYWRRQQEEMMQAQPSPEQQREAMRLMMNAQPAIVWRDPPPYEPPAPFWRKRLIRDALSHAEDGLFWWLLVGMALALILRWFLLGGPR